VKVAILSDIHGNLQALEAVLADMRAAGAQQVYCLGDVVGYGANPNECCARVADLAEACVLGNHDEAALGQGSLEYFNSVAKMAALWTMKVMDAPTRDYLQRAPMTFPLVAGEHQALLVHASPDHPADWHYIISEHDARAAFEHCTERLIFVGHSHAPGIFTLAGSEVGVLRTAACTLAPGTRYLVNDGSVGQPRDGDPRAAWCLFDAQAGTLEVRRVAYDVGAAQAAIRGAQLPEILASRLAWGE